MNGIVLELILMAAGGCFAGYKVYRSSRELNKSKDRIIELTKQLSDATSTIITKDGVIRAQNESIVDLNKSIDALNIKNAEYAVELDTSKEKLATWRKLSDEAKYKTVSDTVGDTDTVTDGVELNKKISELDYDKL